jgi:hypothetical protein
MVRRRPRGFSFVSLLLLAGLLAAGYWIWAFGPAYYDNHELKQILREGGNLAYTQKDDKVVRAFLIRRIDQMFGFDETDARGQPKRSLRIQYEPDELVLERSPAPPQIRIALTYGRTIPMPLVGGERSLVFFDEIVQDLSLVKY